MELASGSDRLRDHLNSIRQSIVRFEKELSVGAERKQRENDQKFDMLRKQLQELESVLENESQRVAQEVCSMEDNFRTTMSVTTDDIMNRFSHQLELKAKHLETFTNRCKSFGEKIKRIENRRQDSDLEDSIRTMKLGLERLRSLLDDYAVEHEAIEKEVLRKVLHLQNTMDQQMDYWMLLLNDGVTEMRGLLSYEQDDNFTPTDAEQFRSEILGQLENGLAIPPRLFEKFVLQELAVVSGDLEECKNERLSADEEIIQAVQKYTQTLQKSLEAAEMLKTFADNISKEL